MRIVIIGSGNVAEALAIAIAKGDNGLVLTQIYGRNRQRVNEIAEIAGCKNTAHEPQDLAKAELYIISVKDSAIAEVSAQLPFAQGAIVAHTAASVSIETIQVSKGVKRAVLYPLQSFTSGRSLDFTTIPLFIEAEDSEGFTIIKYVAKKLSDSVIKCSLERRKKLHLGAVFACNFVNAMIIASTNILEENDLPPNLYHRLIQETISKAMLPDIHPMMMQSGPAIRGDRETIERHLELLKDSPELIEIYKIISTYIWETSKKI